MIKEETALTRRALTKGQHAQSSTEQARNIRTSSSSLSNQERSMIQQVERILTSVAEREGVDLEDFRAQLNAVLARLMKITGAELGGAEASEKPEEL